MLLRVQMLVTMIDDDPFVGRIATGRIASGVVKVNDRVKVITRDGATTPGKLAIT
jgi:GTP-binding protein